MKITFRLLVFVLISLSLSTLVRGESYAILEGTVTDTSGKPLVGANIIVKENAMGCASDANGKYLLKLPPGKYHLIVSFIGYEKRTKYVTLKKRSKVTLNFKLKTKMYSIGGITVYGEREIIPEGPVTKSFIRSGEIEHMQASSLSDVLKLIPGQRFDNPGLDEVKQIALRTVPNDDDAWRNASLGTQIVLDDIPLSNNANLQIDTRVNTSDVQRTTANAGIDLRLIPAENIDEIEVIRGIPSVKYGDLTSGIIMVKSRDEVRPGRLKLKFNMNNQEGNFSGGFSTALGNLIYNLNLATNQRDVRVPGDGFSRFAIQVTHTNKLYHNLWNMKNRFFFTRAYDEQGLRKGDLLLSERYNRDHLLRINHESKMMLTPDKYLLFVGSWQLNRQNSFSRRLISIDHTYVTDRMTEGVQEGKFVQSYISDLKVKGRVWNTYINLEYSSSQIFWKYQHRFLSGISFIKEKNDGKGRVFDPLSPPSITSIMRDRPRSYSDIPALSRVSLFWEDKISGKFLIPFTLLIGLRGEFYQPEIIRRTKLVVNNGKYFNPRLNLALNPASGTRVRLGYGETSKSPTLAMLYPNPVFFDVDDINRFTGDDNFVVVSTYIFPKENRGLRGSKQIKREVSLDRSFKKFGISLTAFSSSTMGGFAATGMRSVSLFKYDYPDWPDTSNKTIRDTIYQTYSIWENSQFNHDRGIEFSFQTESITPLNLKFRLEAAYTFSKSYKGEYDYSSTFRYDENLRNFVKPFWNPTSGWSDNLIINYRVEFQLKEAGIWITLESQQIVFDRDKITGLSDSLAVGYFNELGERIIIPESERQNPLYEGLHRIYSSWWKKTENKKNVFLFNLRVSKSVGRNGEFSFFINNIFNSHPVYHRKRIPEGSQSVTRLNPDLYFGLESSFIFRK